MTKCSICGKDKGNLILADPQLRCLDCISTLIAFYKSLFIDYLLGNTHPRLR